MVAGLLVLGAVTLLLWPFGLLPDVSMLSVGSALFAGGAVADSFRERPRRWVVAVVAGVLLVGAAAVLGLTVAWLVSPPAADLGVQAGILLGLPPGVGLFTWVTDRMNPPAPAASAAGG